MKKSFLSFYFIIAMALIIVLIIGCMKERVECEDNLGCIELQKGEPIRIAVLQPLSGRLKDSGTVQIRGIELALEDRGYMIESHPVELVFEDSQCSSEGGANAAIKVINDPKVVGIIGTNCSGAAAEASKIMSEAGLVMISGTNSAASLTSTDGVANENWYPGYFRTMYNAIGRGETGAIFTYNNLGLRRVATIHDGDSRSIELVNNFEKVYKELGGEIVLSTAIDRGDKDMKPVLERVSASGAELIFYPFFPPETGYLTKQARELPSLNSVALMVCGSTMRSDIFIDEVGEAGKGLYFVGKAKLSGDVFDSLTDRYNDKYSDLQGRINYAFAYDATNILINAIEKSLTIRSDGTAFIGRETLRSNMYSTRNLDGATGTLSSDSFGDCGTPKFNILKLEDPELGIEGLFNNEVFFYIPER